MAADSGMYRTGPIVFATIRPSGAMTNVSGTPVTPKSIAVGRPGIVHERPPNAGGAREALRGRRPDPRTRRRRR